MSRVPVPCATCGTEFIPKVWNQTYCAPSCRPQTRFTAAPCTECGQVGRTKGGLCNLHYKRRQRASRVIEMQECADPSCTNEFRPQGRKVYCSPTCGYSPCRACGRVERLVHGLCHAHYEQVRKHGALTDPQPPTYRTVHLWLREQRGPASTHQCAICGKRGRDWAFDNQEPSRAEPVSGRLYYEDLDRYRPLCRNCHRREDGLPACPHGDGSEKDARGRCLRCAEDRKARERFGMVPPVVY